MKKYLLILVCFSIIFLTANYASAQTYNQKEKRITIVSGKKKVIKSAVRDTDEIQYVFKVRSGQKLSVKILGRDADFKVIWLGEFDAEQASEDVKSWSGKVLGTFEKCMIAVHSNYKVADFTLEIILK